MSDIPVSGQIESTKSASRGSRRFAQLGLSIVLFVIVCCFSSMLIFSGGFSRMADAVPTQPGR